MHNYLIKVKKNQQFCVSNCGKRVIIQSDFPNDEIIELVEKEIELNEGLYHHGIGSVIRFVGRRMVDVC